MIKKDIKHAITSIFFLTVICITWISTTLNSQSSSHNQDIIKHAEFTGGDLTKFLKKHTIYPTYSLQKNEQGYVIIQFTITETNKLESLKTLMMPSVTLNNALQHAIEQTMHRWQSAQSGNSPVSRQYKIAARFVISPEKLFTKNFKKAINLIERGKYSKALHQLNKAIEQNQFHNEAYLKRSEVKLKLGDGHGASEDRKTYLHYKDQFIASFVVRVNPTSSSEIIFSTDARR